MRFLGISQLLRAASIVSLLYCLGHMSGLPWTPGTTEAAGTAVQQMQTAQFEAEGAMRTYWDFYFGFGLIVGVFLAAQAVTLWLLERIAAPAPQRLVPLLAMTLIGVLANAYLSYRYFFALPAAFSLVIALLLAGAIYRARASAPARV